MRYTLNSHDDDEPHQKKKGRGGGKDIGFLFALQYNLKWTEFAIVFQESPLINCKITHKTKCFI